MKVLSNRSAITKVQAAVIVVIIAAAAIVAVVYYVTVPSAPVERPLRVGFSWPTYIDPAVGSDFSSSASLCNLYDPLVWPTPEGEADPWVAESWTTSADGKVWTFTIRDGIKFHTGRELTAEDVKFSMERLIAVERGYSYLFSPYIETVEVVDGDKVKFTLKATFGPFLTALVRLYILDEEEVMENIKTPGDFGDLGDYGQDWLLTHDAGSGAYKVVEVVLEEYVKMERFKDYWGEFADDAPTDVTFMATALSPPTTRAMMENKELEITDQWLPEEILDALDAKTGISKVGYIQASEYYYMMHTKKPPLDCIHVRKALAYACDYEELMTEIYSRYVLSKSSVPPVLPGYKETQIYHRDLAKAQEELEQSKYYPDIVDNPDDYVIEIHWIADVPERETDALVLAESAAEIGLNLKLVSTPWMKTVDEMGNIETSGHIYNILVAAHYPEAGSLLESRYHSKAAATWEQNEWLESEELDTMIEDALSTIDTSDRLTKYGEIQDYIMDICPSIFLYDYQAIVAMQDYVDWPAMRDPTTVVAVMGYNYVVRFFGVSPPE